MDKNTDSIKCPVCHSWTLSLTAAAQGCLNNFAPHCHGGPQADLVKNLMQITAPSALFIAHFWSPFSHIAFMCQVEGTWGKVVDTYYFLLCRVSMGQNFILRCGLFKTPMLSEVLIRSSKSWFVTLGSHQEPFSSPWVNWVGLDWNLKEKAGKTFFFPFSYIILFCPHSNPRRVMGQMYVFLFTRSEVWGLEKWTNC